MQNNNSLNKKMLYKMIICIAVLCILLLELFICVHNLAYSSNGKSIEYSEKGDSNYKVTLKQNEYLSDDDINNNGNSSDMIFVSSLIDKVNVSFDYNFRSAKLDECDFDYNVIAKLIIKDSTSDKVFLEKNYKLDSGSEKSTDLDNYVYSKKLDIDYGYYNSLVSSFKTKYGVDSSSYLRVLLNIDKNSQDLSLGESSMYVDIPLSERTVSINISPIGLQNKTKVLDEAKDKFGKKTYMFFLVVICLFIIFDLLIIKFLKVEKSEYDKELSKILRQYDRLIVETQMVTELENKKIVNIFEFKELLDLRDNFKLPIFHYEVVKDQDSLFYITHDDYAYVYRLKREDRGYDYENTISKEAL